MLGVVLAGQCQSGNSGQRIPGGHQAARGSYRSIFQGGLATSLALAATVPLSTTYYYPHFALGGGWQTVLTLVNYSPQIVTCQTTFLSDTGGPLNVSFGGTASSTRTDDLLPGGGIHQQSQSADAAIVGGWAQSQCSGPVQASILFRLFSGATPIGEAGVNAVTTPTTKFVTFAQTQTGVAYANPSATAALITIIALDSSGATVGSTNVTLPPGGHGAVNIGPQLGIAFTGSVQIVSTVPIICLSLNAEAFPAFSSLPAGDLDGSTPLSTGR